MITNWSMMSILHLELGKSKTQTLLKSIRTSLEDPKFDVSSLIMSDVISFPVCFTKLVKLERNESIFCFSITHQILALYHSFHYRLVILPYINQFNKLSSKP